MIRKIQPGLDRDISWMCTVPPEYGGTYGIDIFKYYTYLNSSLVNNSNLYPFYDDIIYSSGIKNLTNASTSITETGINFSKWSEPIFDNRIKFSKIEISEANSKTLYLSNPVKLKLINRYGTFYLSAETSENIYSTLSGLNYKGPVSTSENYWLDDWHCINTSRKCLPLYWQICSRKNLF